MKNRNALRAGIFMIFTIVLIIAGIFSIAGSSKLLEKWRTRTVDFQLTDNLGGLRVGDDVRIGGIKVGQVKSIEIQTEGTPRIVVIFAIPQKYPLKNDAHMGVEGTVTGASWLNIDNLGVGSDLAENQALVGRPSAMSALLASLGDLAPEVRKTVSDARTQTLPRINSTLDTYKETGLHATALVDHVKSKVDPAMDKYNGLADAGRDALGNIRDMIGSKNGDFKSFLANMSGASASVKEKIPALLDRVHEVATKLSGTLDSTREAMEDIKKTAANARDATASIRDILASNRGKIDGMIASLKTAGDNLKFATAEVRRSPWRLLYKPAPNEMANLNIYDSARQFAEGANSLNDATLALRDALRAKADADQIKKLSEKLDETFTKFQVVETELWKQVKE